MRILWLCNIMLPVIAEALGKESSNKEGWLAGLAGQILESSEKSQVELGVCFPVENQGDVVSGLTKDISYYSFVEDVSHAHRYDKALESSLRNIVDDFQPDIVHIFGTEYAHTLAMTRAFARPERILIGIQGVCYEYAKAYMADLPVSVQRRFLFRDMIKQDNIRQQQRKFELRGVHEIKALQNVKNITGRTDFDKKVAREVNPEAEYYFMNETLRSNFYMDSWSYEGCEKHSIFLSQGNYPIKGLHYMLEALAVIRKEYPAVHVYVAGDVITRYESLKDKIKISSYGKYIRDRIHANRLEECITFVGKKNAEEMKVYYLKAHVFVSPSSIENSPNSVGEAMLLGVPTVSSAVGGVANMLVDREEGLLYPCHDVDSLARCVIRIFNDEDYAGKISRAAKIHAADNHNPQKNYERLLEIYHEIWRK